MATFRLLLFKPSAHSRVRERPAQEISRPGEAHFVFFALSLVLYSIHRPTAVYDVRTLAAADSAGEFSRFLDELAEKRGMPTAQFAQEVNTRWQSYLSMSQVAYPLFVAVALKLLFRRRGLYFAEHLIFALHLLAFTFLTSSLAWPFYALFGVQASVESLTAASVVITAGSIGWTVVYLVLAMRRAYAERWRPALIKSGVVYLTYFLVSMFFPVAASARDRADA